MSSFTYKAKKSPTEEVSGTLVADSRDAALEQLTAAGLTPVRIEAADGSPAGLSETAKFRALRAVNHSRIPAVEIDVFTRELASLLRARVPVLKSLSVLRAETRGKGLAVVLEYLEGRVRDGCMLSAVMAQFPRAFDRIYVAMVRAGETAGDLPTMLEHLADYREREREAFGRIRMALVYPAIVLALGVATVFLALAFFLPEMMTLYRDLGQELPAPTRLLRDASAFLGKTWLFWLLAAGLVGAFFCKMEAGSRRRKIIDTIKLHVPLIRKFVLVADLAKFSRTLALLLRQKIPVVDGVRVAKDAVDNAALRAHLETALTAMIEQGEKLSGGLKRSGVLPGFCLQIVAVGEEGGNLAAAFGEVNRICERQVDARVKLVTTVVEPFLILVVGAAVGFIVFAMLLPIMDMGALAG